MGYKGAVLAYAGHKCGDADTGVDKQIQGVAMTGTGRSSVIFIFVSLLFVGTPGFAGDRCFDGFRVETLAAPVKGTDSAKNVDVAFDMVVKNQDASAVVVNATVDISRANVAFVLNAALVSGFYVGLCFSDPKEVALIEKAVGRKNLTGVPREEVNAHSVSVVTIPYTRD